MRNARSLPKVEFRPFPLTYFRPQTKEKVKIEVEIKEGEVARFLSLPSYLANALSIYLDEKATCGFPSSFFIVEALGPGEHNHGGYIGEHRGPKTLQIWLANDTLSGLNVSGAFAIEPVEEVEAELARDRRAAAWEEKKDHIFEAAMAHIPVLLAAIAKREGVTSAGSAADLIARLIGLIKELRAEQMHAILAVLEEDKQAHFMKILEEMMIFA